MYLESVNGTVIEKYLAFYQAIENSRQFLVLRTDIWLKTVVGCPCLLTSPRKPPSLLLTLPKQRYKVINEFQSREIWGDSIAFSVAPFKGIHDSPGFWILRLGFRIPKHRIQNSSIKNSKIPDSWFGFPCMARALGLRQIHCIYNDCHFLLEDEDELLESIAKSSALLQDG